MKKSNEIIKMNILNSLAKLEYTHTYVIAIKQNKMVYACIIEDADKLLPTITYCEPQATSHNSIYGVRINGTKTNMQIIRDSAKKVIPLCSVEMFKYIYKTEGNRGSNNRGHIFEKLCAEKMNGYQVDKKNAKCTESGDIVVNGEHIQCKLWNATVTTEVTIRNFEKLRERRYKSP